MRPTSIEEIGAILANDRMPRFTWPPQLYFGKNAVCSAVFR
jgi:hypothetical protein